MGGSKVKRLEAQLEGLQIDLAFPRPPGGEEHIHNVKEYQLNSSPPPPTRGKIHKSVSTWSRCSPQT